MMVSNNPVAALVLLASLLPAQAKSPNLIQARQLLGGASEQQVHEGADLCLKENNVAAVELLLEVLGTTHRRALAPAHYRDIVWDRLAKITDLYARRRVELELKTSDDPHLRQWCAELLGIYGDRSFGDSLIKALSSRDADVQRWAARSLGMLQYGQAQSELQPLTHHKNDYVRANAIEALAHIDGKHLPAFTAAISADASGGVRCALLGAAPQLCPDRVEELSATAVHDQDWRPLMQAVQNLGRIKTKGAVDALLEALSDTRPAIMNRALRELQELTGQPIPIADTWRKWWADNRVTFEFPEKRGVPQKTKGETVAYNGVPIDSGHVAFLLDKSVLMKERLHSKDTSKELAAQAELKRVLELLEGRITFNVFNYHDTVTACTPKPVPLSAKARSKALEFAAAPSSGREKDIWQALSTVIADDTLDTVYLLSSGEPDTGLYVHWNRVTRYLADLDRFHKVVVHTVAYTDSEWFRDQLQKIAEVTGGQFQWFK